MKSFPTKPQARRLVCTFLTLIGLSASVQAEPWLTLPANDGPGEGRHIVLISGDEEYRSEEAMPMLGRLLAERHGFRCTVLFAINPATGAIDPNTTDNIPGLQALERADLMVVFTRFRNLPDAQMQLVDAYVNAGKPVVGIRPSVVAFRPPRESRFFKYSSDNSGPEYAGGFGQQVLGSTWISHHGRHGVESTRGLPVPAMADHPILRGVGPMWGPTDVYTIRTPIPEDGQVLVMGQVLQGMAPSDSPADKPMMPLAWTKSHQTPGGEARVFMTTMGASQDFLDDNFRRLVVNACYWALGLEARIPPRSNVDFVSPYDPTPFGFDAFRRGVFPAELASGIPAPKPAKPIRQMDGSTWVLRSGTLEVTWQLDAVGLKPGTWTDRRSGERHAFEGEAFEIRQADGQRYAASEMAPEAGPEIISLPARPEASREAERLGGQALQVTLRSSDERFRVVWRAIVPQKGDYQRQEIAITPLNAECLIDELRWLDTSWPGALQAGMIDGSPIVAGPFFFGCEDPMARNEVTPGRVFCRLPRRAPLRLGETLEQSFVIGAAPEPERRRAFLRYLEQERAHPYRPFLHYNSWYDTAYTPFALNESNCLAAIDLIGERLIRRHGIVVDAMVFDDGWDDPRTLWRFHEGFPNGFTPLAERCREYGTRLGVWLSPFGGYGEPKAQRLAFGRSQGYEINGTGFSLAGPKYYENFKRACVDMIRRYGVNHFKFDGIAAGMYADGGAEYVLDTEAMRRLMLELREVDPALYINFTTGSWPSPFWLRCADSLWRQGGDMGLAGKGVRQQQWLTYRDQETYRNVVRRSPLFPLNSLMTQGVAYSRQGSAGDPSFNSAGFKDDVRAFFGSGTGLQELYIQPDRLNDTDWAVLAEAARWSRANADVLVDTHWIGGDPGELEVYGYASWQPRKGIVMLRNPDDVPRPFTLDLAAAFELPPGAATHYRLRSPWAEDAEEPTIEVDAGQPWKVELAPFAVRIWEALPVR